MITGSDATDGAGETHGVDQLLDALSIAGEELTESDAAGSIVRLLDRDYISCKQ